MLDSERLIQDPLAKKAIYEGLSDDERQFFALIGGKIPIDLDQFLLKADWFRANKISGEHLPFQSNWIEEQRKYRLKWLMLFKWVSCLLQENRINHVFVKYLNIKYPLAADVDLLIENPIEIVRAIEALEKEGCVLYEMDRVIRPPLKITAVHPDFPGIDIDIYTEPSWDTFRFHDRWTITQKRKLRSIYGVKVYSPTCEDDLILVSTHALSHGRFTAGEILHGVNVLTEQGRDFDWDYICECCRKWAIQDALYIYFVLVEGYSQFYHENQLVPKDVFRTLSNTFSTRLVSSWLVRSSRHEFPLWLPLNLLYTLALLRAGKLLRKGISPAGDLTRVSLEWLSGGRGRRVKKP